MIPYAIPVDLPWVLQYGLPLVFSILWGLGVGENLSGVVLALKALLAQLEPMSSAMAPVPGKGRGL